ncbi:hypothetical protein QBC34DRAFT_44424 [Podospora aff. communis PSN243]|uniref:Secreted protein n=1 Tax=Podospora aff. communis PSN243 TaxID=3040156 RepID=A0AAV9GUX3_9PEZI|nr:hypothetical protein QBC34DRAFT_44424 [Podospora aff. communis PSN243]
MSLMAPLVLRQLLCRPVLHRAAASTCLDLHPKWWLCWRQLLRPVSTGTAETERNKSRKTPPAIIYAPLRDWGVREGGGEPEEPSCRPPRSAGLVLRCWKGLQSRGARLAGASRVPHHRSQGTGIELTATCRARLISLLLYMVLQGCRRSSQPTEPRHAQSRCGGRLSRCRRRICCASSVERAEQSVASLAETPGPSTG